jgi:hypothetical protein
VTEFTFDAPGYFVMVESVMVLPQSSQKRQLLAISAATCAEWAVLFLLDGFRARAAAKIGIDHFTLIPRGL